MASPWGQGGVGQWGPPPTEQALLLQDRQQASQGLGTLAAMLGGGIGGGLQKDAQGNRGGLKGALQGAAEGGDDRYAKEAKEARSLRALMEVYDPDGKDKYTSMGVDSLRGTAQKFAVKQALQQEAEKMQLQRERNASLKEYYDSMGARQQNAAAEQQARTTSLLEFNQAMAGGQDPWTAATNSRFPLEPSEASRMVEAQSPRRTAGVLAPSAKAQVSALTKAYETAVEERDTARARWQGMKPGTQTWKDKVTEARAADLKAQKALDQLQALEGGSPVANVPAKVGQAAGKALRFVLDPNGSLVPVE